MRTGDPGLRRARRSGRVRRVLPRIYADAVLADDPATLCRAALAYAGGRGALSHTTALAVWGLIEAATPLHLTVPGDVYLRSRPGLAVHRRRGFAPEPPWTRMRSGLVVTSLEQSLVDSWPLLPAEDRRGPVITAVNDRLTTPERIEAALAGHARLADRHGLSELLAKLAAGCRSPLEIWGHDRVFTGPGMPAFRRQYPVRIGGRVYYLDLFAEREMVNFELDGAATHADPRQREADLYRDAQMATLGILAVRFSGRRLAREAEAVRRECLAILASRSH